MIFVWIPKTSGTSIYETLREKEGMKLYLDNYREFDNSGSVTFGHLSLKHLLREGIISKEYYQNRYVFAVVRNPYSRFVSLWKDFKRSHRISPSTTLTEFAFACSTMDREPGLYNAKGYSQCSCQTEWLFPGVDTLRYEKIEEQFKNRFGYELPHLNKSDTTDWVKYYDTESERIVRSMYQDAFILLKYDYIT